MKTSQITNFFTTGLILFISLSSKNVFSQENFDTKKITVMLKNFYTSYIHENTTFPVNQKKIDSIMKKYCTPNVFNQFKGEIEYDPFLKSQMVDTLMLQTLVIEKDAEKNNLYHITYTYGEAKTRINLLVIKEKQNYKIDLIYRDS
jgi:hypothetical protein